MKTAVEYKGAVYVEAGAGAKGKRALKPKKPRQFGNARPQKVEVTHPHNGPHIVKKSPGGHPLKLRDHKVERKRKPKKVKVPKWK